MRKRKPRNETMHWENLTNQLEDFANQQIKVRWLRVPILDVYLRKQIKFDKTALVIANVIAEPSRAGRWRHFMAVVDEVFNNRRQEYKPKLLYIENVLNEHFDNHLRRNGWEAIDFYGGLQTDFVMPIKNLKSNYGGNSN